MKSKLEIIEKYQGIIFPFLDILINGINLFIHIYISWYITKNDYGKLNAALSFTTLMMVTGVSLQIIIAKNIADPKWNNGYFKVLIKKAEKIIALITLIAILLLPMIKILLRTSYLTLILIIMIFIMNSLLSLYRGVYQGEKKFLYLSRSFYLEVFIKAISIFILLYVFKVMEMVLIGVLLGMISVLIIDRSKVNKSFKNIDTLNNTVIRSTFKEIFIANFFYYYLTSISLILVNFFLQNQSGIYAVSIRYGQIYIHIGFSIITVLIPILSKYKYSDLEFQKLSKKFLYICLVIGLLGLVFYKKILPRTVEILFGSSYKQASDYIFIQSIGYFLFIIGNYFVTMEIIRDKKEHLFNLLITSIILTSGIIIFRKSLISIIYIEIISFAYLAITLGIKFFKKEDNNMNKTKKTKLLFLSWRDIKAPKMGGAEVFTHEMLKKVDKEKFEIIHFSPMFKKSKKRELIDGVLYIRKGNIFTVIFYAFIYYLSNRKNINYVIDQCNEHRFFTPFWVKRSKRIFFIHQLGRELWLRNLKFPLSLIGYYGENLITKIYRKNITFTVSESTKNDLLDMGFKDKLVKILPEGINFKPWEKELFLEKDKGFIFTYVGRFARYKGIDSAIEAYGKLKETYPQSKLWIIGKENDVFKKDVLLPIINKYNLLIGLDIFFYGFVSEEKKLELMSRSYSLLYPSDREGWGLTITEAGVVGTPTIVYDSPGLIDAVDHGNAGFVTSTNNYDGILNCMIESIENKKYYRKIRKNAYNFSKQFKWSETARVLEFEMELIIKEGNNENYNGNYNLQ